MNNFGPPNHTKRHNKTPLIHQPEIVTAILDDCRQIDEEMSIMGEELKTQDKTISHIKNKFKENLNKSQKLKLELNQFLRNFSGWQLYGLFIIQTIIFIVLVLKL